MICRGALSEPNGRAPTTRSGRWPRRLRAVGSRIHKATTRGGSDRDSHPHQGAGAIDQWRALNGVPLATRTILLTADIERDEVVKALQLGARGLVMKNSASELLMKAMRMVMAGQYWIGRESVSGLVETLRTQMFASSEPKFGLTPRELEIVAAVAAGYSNKEMAQRIYNKLHVAKRLELALFAISQHLVDR